MPTDRILTGTELIEKLDIADINVLPEIIKSKTEIRHPYRIINGAERDEVMLSVFSNLQANKFRVSGENNNAVWEKGWGEVLTSVENKSQFSPEFLTPQYFVKEAVYRLFGDYISSESNHFMYDIDQVIRSLVFSKYLTNWKRIVEIGSGTGISQYLLAQICQPTTELIGSDWATKSLELLKVISGHLKRPIQPVLFNMLTLDGYQNLNIDGDTAIFTVHTLEQLGKSYKPLLQRLLASKPGLCVHLEPIRELYHANNLMDYLAIRYHDIRNYIDGWLTDLRELEKDNKVKIIEQKKIQIGNKYHEAYNLIVWRPC